MLCFCCSWWCTQCNSLGIKEGGVGQFVPAVSMCSQRKLSSKRPVCTRSDVFPWHYNQYTLTALVTLLSTGHSLDGPSFHWSLSASIWPQLLTTCHSLDGQDCWSLSPLITWSLFWPLVTFLTTGHSLDNWPFPWPLVRLQHLTTSLYLKCYIVKF